MSIIVCCYNSVNRLPDTLRHLACQKVPPGIAWEVIVVDNNSTDDTAEEAKRLWQLNSEPAPLVVVKEEKVGLSHARERGIATSKYGIIIFCDDDNWLAPDYLARAIAFMESHPKAAVVGGRSRAAFEGIPPEWFKRYENNYAVGSPQEFDGDVTNRKGFVWGAGMVIRKYPLNQLACKGFKSLLTGRSGKKLSSGDDTELCFALKLMGWQIWYNSGLEFMHYMPISRLTWMYLRKMHRGFGRCNVSLDAYRRNFSHENIHKVNNSWRSEVLKCIKQLRREYRFLVKMQLKVCEGNGKVIQIEYVIGRLEELLRLRGQYKKQFQVIDEISLKFKNSP